MNEHTDLRNAFGGDISIPPKLQMLVTSINAGELDGEYLSGSFSVSFEDYGSTTSWFAQPSTPSSDFASLKLAVFGKNPDGSAFAIWDAPDGGRPVVFLGSEGEHAPLATDFDEFLRLLAIGYENLGPGNWDEPADVANEDQGSVNVDFQNWVQARGLSVPETGAGIVSSAETRYGEFSGWCDEAVDGTLLENSKNVQGETAKDERTPFFGAVPNDQSIWELMVASIGQRIDSPVANTLIEAIGTKPLKSTNPMNESTYTTSKRLGIEVSATCNPIHRAYWPPRREDRKYLTYIKQVVIERPYPHPLPYGVRWDMTKEEIRASATLVHVGPYSIPTWVFPSPRPGVQLEASTRDDLAIERLWLQLVTESEFITASDDYERIKPLVYVEDAFFAAWCALNGLLHPDRFPLAVFNALINRQLSPLSFLHIHYERLLWSGDLKPEFVDFMRHYYNGFGLPYEKRWVSDIKTAFGISNHFQNDDGPMTQDTWENYDLIAPLIQTRFAEWAAKD
ncbi:hypothetical protein RMR16_024800 (plasmid) [Agrobacterium sp. rho-13.3]|uniref:hypothetical protein n=1 Tax=Agrobacterium sp. rho-13.3 TaxID=3072980 RepID=UPI002A122815|nr:hypothetical protein [Agrobacterium sp. rho-13.3]MDX8310172.1 hypothetical protein [Agrobacterium sp. rho-13.3]